MQLTSEQLENYADQGYLFLPNCFSQPEIERLKAQLPTIYEKKDTPARIIEADGKNVRMVFGSHSNNEVFRHLSHHPRIINPVMQLLGSSVYVHQHSINAKVALEGDIFRWHQDYAYHREEDGILKPELVVTVVFLDEINEFNGPLMLIPGSHQEGFVSIFKNRPNSVNIRSRNLQVEQPQFNHEVSKSELQRLVNQYGIVAPKGLSGSVIFFHPSCVHGSGSNMYPFDRTVVITVYNSVANLPATTENLRPEFLASRDYRPIEPLSDDVLSI